MLALLYRHASGVCNFYVCEMCLMTFDLVFELYTHHQAHILSRGSPLSLLPPELIVVI